MIRLGVVSGKGGVGKTTIATSIAVALARRGFSVGLVDIDVTGPNVHDILGAGELDISERDRFVPAEAMGVKYVSIGQIASRDLPVLWEPKNIASAARQLVERTEWGDADFLVLDFPPGFGPETIEMLPLIDYAVIVTTPSDLSVSKVRRMVEACREYGVPVAGIIVNMSYFACPHCGAVWRVFPGADLRDLGAPVIAEVPLSPEIASRKIIENFPIDALLEALERPVVLEKRRGRSLKRRILELLLRW
ncbi:MAG: Mrp/NBP35 family ATP-binding protein [Thermofilaceae archaeon]